jgi:hypothetical protein
VRRRKVALGVAVALAVIALSLVIATLLLLPGKAPTSCAGDLFCRADAHQGVIAFATLVIALLAGLLAYFSFSAERVAEARVDELERHEAWQDQQRYRALLGEMLYEAVHNLSHLVGGISPPAAIDPNSEYDGWKLDGRPVLSVRYADQLLDLPYAEKLKRDVPDVLGFIDHALRNARFIERPAYTPAEQEALVKSVVWMSEHLLRVLACVRYRSAKHTSVPASAIAESVLKTAGLSSALDPGDRDPDEKRIETELRDRVRFVRLEARRDKREFDTIVACFGLEGNETELFKSLKKMSDPPTRPAKL